MASCFPFVHFFLCRKVHRKRGKASDPSNASKVKIRVGFEGKDTLFSPDELNVKTTFGQFAVLLDYDDNTLVPLHSNGLIMEPLHPQRKYVVVLNTHGSSSHKWEDMRKQKGGKGKKHNKKSSKSNNNKREKKKKNKNKSKQEQQAYSSERNANGGDESNPKEPLLLVSSKKEEPPLLIKKEDLVVLPEPAAVSSNLVAIDFGASSMDFTNARGVGVYAY